jgi:hypothetical protein
VLCHQVTAVVKTAMWRQGAKMRLGPGKPFAVFSSADGRPCNEVSIVASVSFDQPSATHSCAAKLIGRREAKAEKSQAMAQALSSSTSRSPGPHWRVRPAIAPLLKRSR